MKARRASDARLPGRGRRGAAVAGARRHRRRRDGAARHGRHRDGLLGLAGDGPHRRGRHPHLADGPPHEGVSGAPDRATTTSASCATWPRSPSTRPSPRASPTTSARWRPGKLADIVLWRPEFFGVKPQTGAQGRVRGLGAGRLRQRQHPPRPAPDLPPDVRLVRGGAGLAGGGVRVASVDRQRPGEAAAAPAQALRRRRTPARSRRRASSTTRRRRRCASIRQR